jgi:hypothetical protein
VAWVNTIRLGYAKIYRNPDVPNVAIGVGGMAICADGANGQTGGRPAYGPPETRPLDYLSNAGHPRDWYGVVADADGNPVVQGKGDPCPGAYVSTTALADKSRPAHDPRRYVDAAGVPFLVIPVHPQFGIRLGNLAMVFRPSTGDSSAAIVADIGPGWRFGEGSIRLAKNLKVPSDPKSGGVAHGIVYVMFDDASVRWDEGLNFYRQADEAFKKAGGFTMLKEALPEFDWGKF